MSKSIGRKPPNLQMSMQHMMPQNNVMRTHLQVFTSTNVKVPPQIKSTLNLWYHYGLLYKGFIGTTRDKYKIV